MENLNYVIKFISDSQILPKWEAVKTGTISFKFRTNEPNGLVLFNMGAKPPRVGCTVRGGAFGVRPIT